MAAQINKRMGPQFSPVGGVGSIWQDPQSNEKWKYTSQGWVKESSKSVQKDVEEKGTFQIHDEEEQTLVEQLQAGGSSQEQIQQGLSERRRVLSNMQAQEKMTPGGQGVEDPSNPFGLMTKREMLRDAFNNGVTDIGELEKLEGIYDMLIGEEEEIDIPDMAGLSPEEQQVAKEQLRKIIITRGQGLGTGEEREGVLGAVGTFDTGQSLIDMLSGEDAISTGPIAGRIRSGVSVFGVNVLPGTRSMGKTTQEEDKLAALTTVYTAQFIKAISGAQVSDREREFLMQALPSETKQEQANIEGIKAIEDFLSNRYSASLGVDMSPLKSRSKTEEEDPLNIFGGGSTRNPLGI